MKKTLLSVAASAMLMAGGDIAPVEPAVVTPAVVETSAWNFNGEAKAFYQTEDAEGVADLGDGATTAGNLGVQVSVENKDVAFGIGAGAELITVIGNQDFSQRNTISADGTDRSMAAAVTQAYLTYGIGNTDMKLGRMELSKTLSPFAFSESEDYNMFTNTFEGAVVVNSDIKDTTLVGAYVTRGNSVADLSEFTDLNEDGIYMLTAQNKSVKDLTLTGTYYSVPDYQVAGDANILWADAGYAMGDYKFGAQGGYVFGDAVEDVETKAFGAKAGIHKGNLKGCLSYSKVSDGALAVANLAGDRTPLYTQMVENQNYISSDSDTVVARGILTAYGADFGLAYGYTSDNSTTETDYQEVDLTYTRKLGKNTELYAAYVYSDLDQTGTDANNLVRIWGKYNF